MEDGEGKGRDVERKRLVWVYFYYFYNILIWFCNCKINRGIRVLKLGSLKEEVVWCNGKNFEFVDFRRFGLGKLFNFWIVFFLFESEGVWVSDLRFFFVVWLYVFRVVFLFCKIFDCVFVNDVNFFE